MCYQPHSVPVVPWYLSAPVGGLGRELVIRTAIRWQRREQSQGVTDWLTTQSSQRWVSEYLTSERAKLDCLLELAGQGHC